MTSIISTLDERDLGQTNLNSQVVHYCPQGFEEYKLYDVIGDGCLLCTELKLLELLKEELTRKTAQLRVKINQTHSVINRKLPPEILATIFQAYVHDPFYEDPFSEAEQVSEPLDHILTGYTPLLLGAVCRTWRDIAWSTPRLWASITIPVNSRSTRCSMKMLLTKEWLSRAGQLPLSICLTSNALLDEVHGIRPLINLLNQYSARWRNLLIDLPTCTFPWFTTVGNGAPLLEYLKVNGMQHYLNDDSLEGDNLEVLNLGNTPSLKYLSMRRIGLHKLKLDLHTLTHFSGENLSEYEGLEILRRAPLLEYNVIRCLTTSRSTAAAVEDAYDPSFAPIISQHIRTFALTFPNRNNSDFLSKAIYPALDTLSISGPSTTLLPTFFLRSGFTLKRLSLMFIDDDPMRLIGLLFTQPSLVELSLGWSALDLLTSLLEALTSVDAGAMFLPNLETLNFIGTTVDLKWEKFGALFSAVTSADAQHGGAGAESSSRAPEVAMRHHFSRPWRHITMSLIDVEPQNTRATRGVPYIPEPVISRLRCAMAKGVVFDVKVTSSLNSDTAKDWIEVSDEWHDVQKECRGATEVAMGL